MKKLILLSGILLVLVQLSAQKGVIFVKQGAGGNGTSWTNAMSDLQIALKAARPGQEIWVAAGTYYPTQGNDRSASFQIRSNIQLYGGFSGKERTREDRNWYNNLTVLSGEIGTPDKSDNSYTIVYTSQASSNTIVDGFVVTGAQSKGTTPLGSLQRSGGGWFNDGSGGESSPTISNCLFIDNYAREGAGLYNYAKGGTCQPMVRNCQFVSNNAHLEGAAIFNDGRNGKASPIIQHCYFLENASNYGAAIRNLAEGGEAIPKISNSIFEANLSYAREIIYNGAQAGNKSRSILENCRFFDNRVTMGNNSNNTSSLPKKQGYRSEGEIKFIRK